MSKSTGVEDAKKMVGILKKPTPGETPNNAQWFNTMEMYLAGLGLGWVIKPEEKRYAKMKMLEMTAAGSDEAKRAGVELKWLRAEDQVRSILHTTVDQGYRQDIQNMSAAEAWKALQPTSHANVLLKMVTDLLHEKRSDHKSASSYLTRLREAMMQLFADEQAKGLVTEAFIVLVALTELQNQPNGGEWRQWVANIFIQKKNGILDGSFNLAALSAEAGAYDNALGATGGKTKHGGTAYLVPEYRPKGKCFSCGKSGHYGTNQK